MSDNDKPFVAYLWECGDDFCGCSQAVIQRHHPACRHPSDSWGTAHRITGPYLWEGDFDTDHSLKPYDQITEVYRVMVEAWPEVADQVIWL